MFGSSTRFIIQTKTVKLKFNNIKLEQTVEYFGEHPPLTHIKSYFSIWNYKWQLTVAELGSFCSLNKIYKSLRVPQRKRLGEFENFLLQIPPLLPLQSDTSSHFSFRINNYCPCNKIKRKLLFNTLYFLFEMPELTQHQ